MHKDISPEEKLLSIIKGKRDNVQAEKSAPREAETAGGQENTQFGNVLDSYISRILKSSFFKNNLFSPKILKAFNKYMIIVVVISVLYFISDILFVRPSSKAKAVISNFSSLVMPVPASKKPAQIEANTYSYYSNRILGKRIFGAGSYLPTETSNGTEAGGEQAGTNLGLVGIIPGDNPQAIIEDKKDQKTYYLMKGQAVNDIVVEDISSDKVMIEYRGKRMNLFL